jgi:undecaprenyl-diphosphatase
MSRMSRKSAPGAADKPAFPAAAGKAGRARNPGGRLIRWWSQAPNGRTYQRRQADALVAAAGLGIVAVCGVLVASRLGVGTEVALFRQINHWPAWLYPPMWTVQLPGVIGALPLAALAAAVFRRLRLAAALAAATLLKVSLEDTAKMLVQRSRPAETLPDVILRGNSAAHGLSFPSGHAMVIFAITVLVSPLFPRLVEGLALGSGRDSLPVSCIPRRALPIGRSRGDRLGRAHRGGAQPRIRRPEQQLQHRPRERITVSSRARGRGDSVDGARALAPGGNDMLEDDCSSASQGPQATLVWR